MELDRTKDFLDQLIEVLQDATAILASSVAVDYDQVLETLSTLSGSISSIVTTESTQNLSTVMEILTTKIRESTDGLLEDFHTDLSVTCPEKVTKSLQAAIPYLGTEEQDECEEIIQAYSFVPCGKKLSISDAIALLALIISIFSFILQLLPDQQLDKLIEQGDALIAQNEVIIQRQTELEGVLYELGDGIHLLADEIDSIRDGNEDIDDFSKIQGHTDSNDTKQQNAD